MNYQQTIEFLFAQLPAYHRIGKAAYRNNLDNTHDLDDYFGNPHKKFRTIHIAGTNGKGSVSHMIASVLMEAGYKTGLYTSPHLKDFRERIKVDGGMIPKREVTSFIRKHSGIINSVKPSFFEMTVAMAFDYFARSEVDVAVIEVGLGGRLDSTNIITPVISVITNIQHDHMDILGNSLAKIAAEKSGIMKPGVPVVIGETTDETRDIFTMKSGENGVTPVFAEENFDCSLGEPLNISGERRCIIRNRDTGYKYEGIIPLGGDYQEKNLKTVMQTLVLLSGEMSLTDNNITEGIRKVIENTGLSGRWQTLRKKPHVICDTGHNREGLEFVVRQIKAQGAERVHFVLGFVSDKDLSTVLPLFPKDGKYYFTKASVPRALDEKLLKDAALEYGLHGDTFPSVKKALDAAISNASSRDLVFVGGSTFVVADVI
jgi:dihydrofolate synthase / folylpolyglutamate synthase